MEKQSTWKSVIRHPVIAGVAVAFIVSVGTWLLGWLPSIFAWLSDSFTWIAEFLVHQVSLPVWLVIAGVFTLPTIRWIIGAVMRRREPWREYTGDTFDHMTWRWNYCGKKPNNLRAFCPRDDMEVAWEIRRLRHTIVLHCEKCGKIFMSLERTSDDVGVKAAIIRQIDCKIRTGDWKQVVRNSRAPEAHATRT